MKTIQLWEELLIEAEQQVLTSQPQSHAFFAKEQKQEQLHTRLENALQVRKRVNEEVAAKFAQYQGEVKVRNLFVLQHAPLNMMLPLGEFKLDGEEEQADLILETDTEVVQRMFGHIELLTLRACEEHLKHNFDKPKNGEVKEADVLYAGLMKEEKKNDITRLSTHEFSFYPNRTRGPLRIDAFNLLLKQLEALAEQNPENLHLLLGTFPIKDESERVYNVAIYVECGAKPRLTLTTKAIPSRVDPIYPGTGNCFFSKKTCKNKSEHGSFLAESLGQLFHATIHDLNFSIEGVNGIFRRDIHCVTAGNLHFTTAIDICLDHDYQLALRNYVLEFTDAVDYSVDFFPSVISQVVVSNFTSAKFHSSLTGLVEQNDPLQECDELGVTQFSNVGLHYLDQQRGIQTISHEGSKVIEEPEFGPLCEIRSYGAHSLVPLYRDLGVRVAWYNQFMVEVEKINLLRKKNPDLGETYHACMLIHILDSCQQKLQQLFILDYCVDLPDIYKIFDDALDSLCLYKFSDEKLNQLNDGLNQWSKYPDPRIQ